MYKKPLLLFTAAALATCSTLPPYHPASYSGDSGFSEQQLSDTQFRVRFQGSYSTPRAEVEDYLLRRAAEITRGNGYDYFIMSDHNMSSKSKYVTTHSPAVYSRLSHRHRHDDYLFPVLCLWL